MVNAWEVHNHTTRVSPDECEEAGCRYHQQQLLTYIERGRYLSRIHAVVKFVGDGSVENLSYVGKRRITR